MPTVNGRGYDFAAITGLANGAVIPTLDSAEYGGGREITMHHDTKGAPLHHSLGPYQDEDVVLNFAKSDAADFLNAIEPARDGARLGGRVSFNVTYANTDQPETTDELDCLFQRIQDAPSKSDGITMTRVTLKQQAPMIYGGIELMPAASAAGGTGGGGPGVSALSPSGAPFGL